MKLSDISQPKVHPTALEGVFIRDLSLGKIEELGQLDQSENSMESILWLFQNLVCDAEGELFEDAQTEEELKQAGMMTIRAISEAATEALQQGGKS